jgi:hypothetical protein
MFLLNRSKFGSFILCIVLTLTHVGSLAAKQATPTTAASQPAQLDLAAMALLIGDLPQGSSSFGSVYLPVPDSPDASFIPVFNADDLTRHGIRRGYSARFSSYVTVSLVTVLLLEFSSEDEARQSDVLEEVSTTDWTADAVHGSRPLEGIGDQPGYFAVVRWPSEDTVEATLTFRIMNIVAIVQTLWPSSSKVGHLELIDIAKILELRIRKVLKGEPVSGIDYELPSKILTFGPKAFPEAEGYLSPIDVFLPVAAGFWNTSFVSGYRRSSTTDHGSEGPSMPQLTVSVLRFTSDKNAEHFVQSNALLWDAPTDFETVELGRIADSSANRAFAYPYSSYSSRKLDSFSIEASSGSYVVLIDVEEATNERVAQDKGLEMMEDQLACLSNKGICTCIISPPTDTP